MFSTVVHHRLYISCTAGKRPWSEIYAHENYENNLGLKKKVYNSSHFCHGLNHVVDMNYICTTKCLGIKINGVVVVAIECVGM